jgi:hypothetical protein
VNVADLDFIGKPRRGRCAGLAVGVSEDPGWIARLGAANSAESVRTHA